MKKYVTISLFIFWAITVAIITAGLISLNKNEPAITNNNTDQPINTTSGAKSTLPATSTKLGLTLTELKKHNSSKSCWLLVSDKIYDVTSFLNKHPGNASTILPNCGTDATAAYVTRGGTGSHSNSTYAMLVSYYIGDLNQTVNINLATPPTPTILGNSSRRDDDDEDDD